MFWNTVGLHRCQTISLTPSRRLMFWSPVELRRCQTIRILGLTEKEFLDRVELHRCQTNVLRFFISKLFWNTDKLHRCQNRWEFLKSCIITQISNKVYDLGIYDYVFEFCRIAQASNVSPSQVRTDYNIITIKIKYILG